VPRIKYLDLNLKPDSITIIDQARAILNKFSNAGFKLSLRQLYYQFVKDNLFPEKWKDPKTGSTNNERSYDKLGVLMTKARDAGLIDWAHLEDRNRSIEERSHWDDPSSIIRSAAASFNIDLWSDQPTRVEVWVEKDALSDVVGRAAEPLDVPYLAAKGYISASTIWHAGYRRFRPHIEAGQNIVVIHLGDHDPSGIDMTRDIEKRLRLYAGTDNEEALQVRRIALNMDQVEEYNPPPNPAKQTDVRFEKYEAEFGDECWELDALEPQVIMDLIDEQIRSIMDEDLFQAREELQDQGRAELTQISENYSDVVAYLDGTGE
jgi:hypothetical protein